MEKYNSITLGELIVLCEKAGITVEINDGQITGFNFEEDADE